MKTYFLILFGMFCSVFAEVGCAGEIYYDLYKTNQFTLDDLQPELTTSKNELLQARSAYIKGDMKSMQAHYNLAIEPIYEKMDKKGKYVFLNISMVVYPNKPDTYVTIDVVDKSDSERMPVYRAEPKGHYADPSNLIRDWQRYEAAAMPILLSSKKTYDLHDCPEFHCLGSLNTPLLIDYENEFRAEVPKHQEELATMLMQDADPKKRSSAVFLLAYTKSENKLIQWLIPALDDPDGEVRNNATRVFIFMAGKDKHITLPVDKFISLVQSPLATDRNKSLNVLDQLATQERYANPIKTKAGAAILENLKLRQPNLHDSAYLVLTHLSKQHYNDRDYAAWSHWLGLS